MSGICPPIKNNLYDHSCALPKVLHIYTKFLRRKQLNCMCVQAEKSGNIKAERCIYYNLLHLEIILTFPSWLSSWSNYLLVLINTAFLVHNCSASATRTAEWKQKCRDTLWVVFFFLVCLSFRLSLCDFFASHNICQCYLVYNYFCFIEMFTL